MTKEMDSFERIAGQNGRAFIGRRIHGDQIENVRSLLRVEVAEQIL